MIKLKLEGAQRACTPEETLDRMRPHLYAAGITRIGDITGMDRSGIPVAQAIRPDAYRLAVDSGKGMTPAAARCSAMMEAFERSVGESFITTVKAKGNDIQNAETRFQLLKGGAYNPDVELEWAEAYGIKSGTQFLVPAPAVRLASKQHLWPLFGCAFTSTSNGLSSGNTLEEAIAGGLYEVIERDQVSCCFGGKKLGRKVDLEVAQSESVGDLIERLRSKDIFPVLFDCTFDFGVPVYVAYLYDSERNTGLYKGYACHLDPVVAQCRAICEAVQSRTVWMAGSRDDITHESFVKSKQDDNASTLASLLLEKPNVRLDAHEDCSKKTFSEDVDALLLRFERLGLPEPLLKTFEHQYPCSVVRVLAPSLEGYMHAFGQLGERVFK